MTMIENLSTLTTIPKKHLERLLNKVFLCIGDAVEETVLKNEKLTKIGPLFKERIQENEITQI